MVEYTKREQELMGTYFENKGEKLMSNEEKYEAYKNMTPNQRNQTSYDSRFPGSYLSQQRTTPS